MIFDNNDTIEQNSKLSKICRMIKSVFLNWLFSSISRINDFQIRVKLENHSILFLFSINHNHKANIFSYFPVSTHCQIFN